MRYAGTITTYFQNRGYGFITSDADGVSRFFHKSSCTCLPEVGTRVQFEIGAPTKLGKDPQCLNVASIASAEVRK